MEGLKRAVHGIVEDVKAHGTVIGVSVMLTVLIRWMAWVLIPIMLIGAVYAFWRRGIRITIDKTSNREGQND